jgi:DNA repair exonuclease SbcCD ATPase subunit
MRHQQRLLEIGLLLLLAACQTPAPAPPPAEPVCPEPPPPPVASDDGAKALQAYVADLHKALQLAQGRSAADQAQATAQLEALVNSSDPQAEPLKPLLPLLSARLAEQKRLQDNLDKLNQQLRDSQRRNEQLNEKLEALKAIEQTLPAKPGAAPR